MKCHYNSKYGHVGENKPMEMQVIIDVFNGEFRTRKHCQHTKIHWQVILILRKLFLTAASIFIINPITKVLTMILILTISLLLHGYVTPYESLRMNGLESVSLIMQLLIAAINLFWSCDYMGDISTISNYEGISKALVLTEYIIWFIPVLAILIIFAYALCVSIYKTLRNICMKKTV